MFLYTFRASRDPKHSKLHSFNCLAGCFNGGVVRIISDIRLKHGPNAVNLDKCGKFVLADYLSDLADISHIDLSNINSLKGTYWTSSLGAIRPKGGISLTTVLLRDYSRAAAAPGDIATLASVIVNCPKLKKFDAAGCEEMSGEELSRILAG